MIKLVAVDMDGTLLNDSNEISPKNVAAINKLKEKGIEFIICTGRNFNDAKIPVENAGISCDYICMSGAGIFNRYGNQLAHTPLSKVNVIQVFDILQQHNLYNDILTNKGVYTTVSKEYLNDFFYNDFMSMAVNFGIKKENFNKNIKRILSRIKHSASMEELLDRNTIIYKISTIHSNIELLKSLRKDLSAFSQLSVVSSFPINIEITDIKAQKGLALKEYALGRNISMREVMAIGDSENDYSMLSMDFGYTVAMGNADESIKNISKYTTKTNLEDGVAWAIEKYAL